MALAPELSNHLEQTQQRTSTTTIFEEEKVFRMFDPVWVVNNHKRHTFTTVRAMRLAANTSNGQVNKYLVVQKIIARPFQWRLSVSQNESM